MGGASFSSFLSFSFSLPSSSPNPEHGVLMAVGLHEEVLPEFHDRASGCSRKERSLKYLGPLAVHSPKDVMRRWGRLVSRGVADAEQSNVESSRATRATAQETQTIILQRERSGPRMLKGSVLIVPTSSV